MRKMIVGLVAWSSFAAALAGAATPARAQVDVTCSGALTAATVQNVIVPQGAACTLTDMTVLGNVEVKELGRVTIRRGSVNGDVIGEVGSQVRMTRGNVNGSVQGNGARLVSIAGTTIAKDIIVNETASLTVNAGARTGSIEVLKGGAAAINGVTVQGNIKFEESAGAVSAGSNRVTGNFEAYLNTGGLAFNANVITGNLQCKDNLPAPTGSGNIAAVKEDQCAAL